MNELRDFEEELIDYFKTPEGETLFAGRRKGRSKPRTGVWIRKHLLDVGEDYVYRMYQRYSYFMSIANLEDVDKHSFFTYIWLLRHLGLIELTKTVPMDKEPTGIRFKNYYTVVEEKRDNEAWEDPWMIYRYGLPLDEAIEKWKEEYPDRLEKHYEKRMKYPSKPRGRPRLSKIEKMSE